MEFAVLWILDKNIQNRLCRLKPEGYAGGLNAEPVSLWLTLVLNSCGCGRFPPASNVASKKQEKVKHYYAISFFKIKSICLLFSVFCLSCVRWLPCSHSLNG